VSEQRADRVIRGMGWLEPLAELIQKVVGVIYSVPGGRFVKDVLHGQKLLGHPLHPALTDIPLGAWAVGVILDYVVHFTGAIPHMAADLALLIGWVAGLGAAAAGYTDHHETYAHERRVATLHGLIMTVVMLLMGLSLLERFFFVQTLHPAAVALATAALLLAFLGAYLGGHLTFNAGTMVNRNAWAEGPEDYVGVGAAADFPEGRVRRVEAGPMAALVVRREGRLCSIAATCSHAGGPLDEGALEGDIIVCPWHGSRFDVCDGSVHGGPATFPQPKLDVRERDGQVELRLGQPIH